MLPLGSLSLHLDLLLLCNSYPPALQNPLFRALNSFTGIFKAMKDSRDTNRFPAEMSTPIPVVFAD